MTRMTHLKIIVANAASWVATLASIQVFKEALQIVALFCSILVSLGSLWWIKRQAQSLDKRDAPIGAKTNTP